jgi:hypothetical protein
MEDSLPFPMHAVKQETPHFCFIACVQSLLKDHGTKMTQSEILDRFPVELKKGHDTEEGAVKGLDNIAAVLKGLSLSEEPLLSDDTDSTEEMHRYLETKPDVWKDVIILTTGDPYHCLRLAKVKEDGFIVMDPASGDFRFRTTQDFSTEKPRFLFLRPVD